MTCNFYHACLEERHFDSKCWTFRDGNNKAEKICALPFHRKITAIFAETLAFLSTDSERVGKFLAPEGHERFFAHAFILARMDERECIVFNCPTASLLERNNSAMLGGRRFAFAAASLALRASTSSLSGVAGNQISQNLLSSPANAGDPGYESHNRGEPTWVARIRGP